MSSLETPEATPTVHKKKISFYSVALVIQIRRSFAGGSIWRQIRLESGKKSGDGASNVSGALSASSGPIVTS